MRVLPLAPFGADVVDLDPDSADDRAGFAEAFRRYSLVRLNDPELTDEQHTALLASVGDVVVFPYGGGKVNYVLNEPAEPDSPPVGRGELQFHCDMIWCDDWPFHALSLYAEALPSKGGETRFAHGGHAYGLLSDDLKARLAGKRAVHVFDPYLPPDSQKMTEDMMSKYSERSIHDVVARHPYHGEQVLTVAYANVDRIVGLPSAEGRRMLQEIHDVLYAPEAIYRHDWRIGDLVVWDNRVIHHARGDFDPAERRKLRRIATGDEVSLQRRTRRWMEQLPIDAPGAESLIRYSQPAAAPSEQPTTSAM